MKRIFLLLLLLSPIFFQAQSLPSPAEFLGYSLGSQFTPHHSVNDYFEAVARARPGQVSLIEYGRTFEGRPLLLATLSSAGNMERLEEIRSEHLKSLQGGGQGETAVVWLSYNVHGNESVSTEAAMQTLHRLLTDKSEYLDNTIVIIDPCINPDGRERYINWYKQRRNKPFSTDPNSLEHHEGWLSGRGNHYMFDLNRDWAWLTQAESVQRLKQYNRWMPHIHVDFHEQSVDAPYYFAPAAEPYHEVVTPFQREFQEVIGNNHARYFDKNGWFYFTREVFDLFYPSYGDTYPTYNGAIGMTYEQGGGGRAGLGVVTATGDTLKLTDRIAHHLTTGLSTVEVASGHAAALNSEFRAFFRRPGNFKYQSYVLNGGRDQIDALTDLLDRHGITYGSGTGGSVRGFDYGIQGRGSVSVSEESLIIPVSQPRGTLVKVLFEPNARLSDSLTYDITAWSLPYAYGLQALASESAVPLRPRSGSTQTSPGMEPGAFAYLTDWNSMKDARFLSEILQKGIRVRRAEKPFELEGRSWGRGTLIITRADNTSLKDLDNALREAAEKHGKNLTGTRTGRVTSGKDFGSRYVDMIPKVRVAILSGAPTSTLRFGELWHFFEQQLGYPASILGADYFDRVDLSGYDILILPDGYGYRGFLNPERLQHIKNWVREGGQLIAMGRSLQTLGGDDGFGIRRTGKASAGSDDLLTPYKDNRRKRVRNTITGAIFKARVDPTHPIAFGYPDTYYTLKRNSLAFSYLDGGSNVVVLGENPAAVAGFAGSKALERLPETLLLGSENYGQGTVVYFADNPLFRGFWENGKLFMANALFMMD